MSSAGRFEFFSGPGNKFPVHMFVASGYDCRNPGGIPAIKTAIPEGFQRFSRWLRRFAPTPPDRAKGQDPGRGRSCDKTGGLPPAPKCKCVGARSRAIGLPQRGNVTKPRVGPRSSAQPWAVFGNMENVLSAKTWRLIINTRSDCIHTMNTTNNQILLRSPSLAVLAAAPLPRCPAAPPAGRLPPCTACVAQFASRWARYLACFKPARDYC
jgi:hypothetical protein